MAQVGADLSGLELRALAHYMYPADGGEYANEILNGDIHTTNQNAAGLEQETKQRPLSAHNPWCRKRKDWK